MKGVIISCAVWSSSVAFVLALLLITIPSDGKDEVHVQNVELQNSAIRTSPEKVAVDTLDEVHENLLLEQMIVQGEEKYRSPENLEKKESVSLNTDTVKYVACPFEEKEKRILVDFTNKGSVSPLDLSIRADEEYKDASHSLREVQIEAGLYSVQLASYRAHDESSKTFFEESWFFRLLTSNSKEVFKSPETRDMRDDEEKTIELFDEKVLLTEPAVQLSVEHGAYPNKDVQHISPLCVVFDAVSNTSVSEDTTPSSSTNTGVITTKTSVVLPALTKQNIESSMLHGVQVDDSFFSIQKIESVRDGASVYIKIDGVTQPFSSTTLFIHPKEIVLTELSDSSGNFAFRLMDDFTDGKYEVSVASLGSAGNIRVKSNPVYFVKKGDNVEYSALLASVITKSSVTFKTQVAFGLTLLLIFSIVFLLYVSHPLKDESIF
jgi:hypothetical protein